MAYDARMGKILLFGGNEYDGLKDDTWTWDGNNWTELSPAHRPTARNGAAMAYDGSDGEIVLFGGVGSIGGRPERINDTWTWDGDDWTERSPATSPPPDASFTMAYDEATSQLILAGENEAGEFQTWDWTGADWVELDPLMSPPSLSNPSIAFDPASDELLLFGGDAGVELRAETWSWDGADWRQRTPLHSPPARAAESMIGMSGTGQTMLFSEPPASPPGETWIWDGSDWAQHRSPYSTVEPPARSEYALAYDPGREEAVLFGGTNDTTFRLDDTWSYRPVASPAATIESPADGATFTPGQDVATAFSCEESSEGPGLASCMDSNGVAGGVGRLDTSTLGPHTYAVTARSKDGREATAQVEYTVAEAAGAPARPSGSSGSGGSGGSGEPVSPPRATATESPQAVKILHRPRRGHANLGRGRPRYSFRFGAATSGDSFLCQIDRKPFAPCRSPRRYTGLAPGPHVFRVKSVDAAGASSPVRVVHFRVAGRRR